ncbi:HEAT repeat-containing protein 1, partial [Stegodyphus mimosarum]
MPIIVDLLHDDRTINLNECLVISIITALQSLIENIGQFLSSYMESLVTGICKLAIKYSAKKAVCEKLHVLQCLLAKEISVRVLLSSVENGYTKLLSENKSAVIPLMEIFEEKLNCCKYEDIEACSPQLQKFYILLLDFRNLNSSDSSELVESVEASVISCLKTFILKLSVTRFRTFFQKVYQWATSAEEQEQKLRIFTFYRLTCVLSQSLKNLFMLMAKYFLRHAANVLDQNNSSKTGNYFEESITMSSQLLNYVLDTLNFCFLYDDGQLLDKENFEILMQPLVDQLENIHDEVYQEIVESHLSSCIAHFMAAVSDHALWKKLNYQILLKTRHDSPKVRFAALQVIRNVVQKMGDNYLILLPESIPFLAEIMEDESFEVEQECQSVIIEMEKILGEPIRKYF